jgi:hypothetical protein
LQVFRDTALMTVFADPVEPLGIATKQYTDVRGVTSGAVAPADPIAGQLWWDENARVLRVWNEHPTIPAASSWNGLFTTAGGTMTGGLEGPTLTARAGTPFINIDSLHSTGLGAIRFRRNSAPVFEIEVQSDPGSLPHTMRFGAHEAAGEARILLINGAPDNDVTVAANPTKPLGVATKQYVDGLIAALESRVAALE